MYAILSILVIVALVLTLSNSTEPFEQHPEKRRAMVIVEPRAHKSLEYVLHNFHQRMPPSYDLYIFHGETNADFARRAARDIRGRRIRFVRLATKNLTPSEYNTLLTTEWFYDQINAEHILVFQTDTVMCKNSPHNIQQFERYGYIGCPYNDVIGKGKHWGADHSFYGVGGLSMRRKSEALRCIRSERRKGEGEDVFFSDCVEKGYGKKPESAAIMQAFCTQQHFRGKPLGVHKPSQLVHRDRAALTNHCPEVRAIAPWK